MTQQRGEIFFARAEHCQKLSTFCGLSRSASVENRKQHFPKNFDVDPEMRVARLCEAVRFFRKEKQRAHAFFRETRRHDGTRAVAAVEIDAMIVRHDGTRSRAQDVHQKIDVLVNEPFGETQIFALQKFFFENAELRAPILVV